MFRSMFPGYTAVRSLDLYSWNNSSIVFENEGDRIIPSAPNCHLCGQMNLNCKRRCKGERLCLQECLQDVNECMHDCTGFDPGVPGGRCNFVVMCDPHAQVYCYPTLHCE